MSFNFLLSNFAKQAVCETMASSLGDSPAELDEWATAVSEELPPTTVDSVAATAVDASSLACKVGDGGGAVAGGSEEVDAVALSSTMAPVTPPTLLRDAVVVAETPLKRRRLRTLATPLSSPSSGSGVSKPYNLQNSGSVVADIPFSKAVELRRLYSSMCGHSTGVVMMVTWQVAVFSSLWKGQLSGKSEFHGYGLEPNHGWVRVSAYDDLSHRLHDFLSSINEGYGFVEFSALSSAKSFRREHDGALCFKIAPGCAMRRLDTCPLWTEVPAPMLCEDLSEFRGCKDGKICFVTAMVYACKDLKPASERCAEDLIVTLRDQQSQARQCTVFPPLCRSPLWQVGFVLDIFGCIS